MRITVKILYHSTIRFSNMMYLLIFYERQIRFILMYSFLYVIISIANSSFTETSMVDATFNLRLIINGLKTIHSYYYISNNRD